MRNLLALAGGSPRTRTSARRTIASATLLALAACGGAQAPGCDAESTTSLAMREALAVIGERGGMRRVPSNPDQLLDSEGDTVHLTPGGGHMWVRTADGKGVAVLENVRPTRRDPQAGPRTCAADFVLTFFDTPDGTLRGPIEYRSEITQGPGPREHVVRVVLAGPGG